jgi:hypothetical protein
MTEKILDRAERLRDMASTILPVLLRLSEVVSVARIDKRKATYDLLVLTPFPFHSHSAIYVSSCFQPLCTRSFEQKQELMSHL